MTPTGAIPEVRLRPRGARRFLGGHPWVFRDDVDDLGSGGHGDVVRVLGPDRAPLGAAFLSLRSKITLRRVAYGDRTIDAAFWERRIDEALAWRRRVAPDHEATRLVFGESDGIPGLVADLYGEHLVVQVLTAATERWLDVFLDAIAARVRVASVLARNDPSVRALEGLPREVRQLRGTTPPTIEVAEGAIRYAADPWKGQKTGAFLDQRDNREASAAWARGRALDVFSYHGSFALHAARHADRVIAIDASADALARGREQATRNGLANLSFLEANAFEALREFERAGDRFDFIALDPPAFAKSRKDVEAARRGYKEINLRALRLLAPGGILMTSSCSYNLPEEEFAALLDAAAADSGGAFRVVERRAQAKDHPVLTCFPESRYLKCIVLCRIGEDS